jgi:hypothetical protein
VKNLPPLTSVRIVSKFIYTLRLLPSRVSTQGEKYLCLQPLVIIESDAHSPAATLHVGEACLKDKRQAQGERFSEQKMVSHQYSSLLHDKLNQSPNTRAKALAVPS